MRKNSSMPQPESLVRRGNTWVVSISLISYLKGECLPFMASISKYLMTGSMNLWMPMSRCLHLWDSFPPTGYMVLQSCSVRTLQKCLLYQDRSHKATDLCSYKTLILTSVLLGRGWRYVPSWGSLERLFDEGKGKKENDVDHFNWSVATLCSCRKNKKNVQ